MWRYRFGAFVILAVAALVGYFVYTTELPVETASTMTTTPSVVGSPKYAFKLD